ncbi:TRAP transporter small permease subunit [Aestuariibius sp. 2305UL40-4]|uniref:TRAP transporter small permease subunit n=1 Tax=Aestuariibius violaceus TaxID=3234132 RepID=UPI00345E7FDF
MSDKIGAAEDPLPLRWLDHVATAMNVTGSSLILALMVLIGLDVAGRNLLGAPLPGVPEMVSLSIVAIVFLQSPQTLRAGRMPRSTALLDMLTKRSPRLAAAIEDVWDMIGIGVLATVAWATWPRLVRDWERGTFIGAIGDFTAPTWPVKATIVAGSVVLVLQFLARIWRRHRIPDGKAQ